MKHEISGKEKISMALKRKRTDPIPYVRGDRQSERLQSKGNIITPRFIDTNDVTPKISQAPTNKVDDTHSTIPYEPGGDKGPSQHQRH